ncbi:MAG: alpha/beta hydrolase [Betaproteobacteria bacterium]|nr:alpha/beta hydrolase [Betaproteobacteria bacterium]
MPYLERPGKPTLYYELDDYTDPWRAAPALVLQHGFGRSSRFWYSWVPYLSRFYRVIRPDLRGLGRSARNFDVKNELGLQHYLEDLIAITKDIGVDSVHYCGESFGGILGLALAAERPQLFRTLSVVSAPAFIRANGPGHPIQAGGSRPTPTGVCSIGMSTRWVSPTWRYSRLCSLGSRTSARCPTFRKSKRRCLGSIPPKVRLQRTRRYGCWKNGSQK